MAGNSVPTHSFKKSMQAVPIPAKQSRKKACNVQIDSGLLFQRIISTCYNATEGVREAFSYDLAHFPLSLFDDCGKHLNMN